MAEDLNVNVDVDENLHIFARSEQSVISVIVIHLVLNPE
jgi:hypothetical protein